MPQTTRASADARNSVALVRVFGYVIAVGAVVLTIAIKFLFAGLGSDHPFVLLTAAVALAAWYGGRGPGLLATALVSAASGLLFLPGSEPMTSGDLAAVVALLAEGVLVVALTTALRSARSRAEITSAASDAAHREAAFALAVRDEMLTLWTQHLRGPLADVETQARGALDDLHSGGDIASNSTSSSTMRLGSAGRRCDGTRPTAKRPDERVPA